MDADGRAAVTTIGFTRTSAEAFFGRLKAAGVRSVLDVRLHNTSQLAGFAKSGDLAWFLGALGGIAYRQEPLLAPTDAMLRAYRQGKGAWDDYSARFLALLAERRVEERLSPAALHGACLLCSEATAHRCHRRLAAEYLNERWCGRLDVRHL